MDDILLDFLTDEELEQLDDEFYENEVDKFFEFIFEHQIDQENCRCELCELMKNNIYIKRKGKIESNDSILDDVSILNFLDTE